jgi:uncharacterized SAM-binding protein YcdF (DUF218 family)
MFFILSKTISFILMPIFWLFTLLFYAFFTKNEKNRKKIIKYFIILLFFFTNPFIINTLMLWWEVPPTPIKNIPNQKIAVVLTGITKFKIPNDRTYFDAGADRIIHALWLYKEKKVEKILITGGNISIFGDVKISEAKRLKDFLMIAGVADKDIILEENAKNTRENALFTKQILNKDFPNSSIILITSAFHLPRAKGCFDKIKVKNMGFSAGFYAQDWNEIGFYSFVPSEKALFWWYILIHEIVGYWTYFLMGYL